MIRVIVADKSHAGRFDYTVEGYSIQGRSREPLLDACRRLKSMGEPSRTEIGLFREGRTDWDLKTTVGYGAGLTVEENNTHHCFSKYRKMSDVSSLVRQKSPKV